MVDKKEFQQWFNDKADLYRDTRPHYPPALFEALAALCGEHSRAWDAACGNGQASLGLAEHFSQIIATDISRQQLANAFPHERVQYALQASEALAFPENTFDLVCVAQALHWFDYDKFWPEVKRVLKPGGLFAAWGYSWLKGDDAVFQLIEREVSAVVRPYWAPQNSLLWNQYRDVPFPFERLDIPAFELVLQWDLKALFGYIHSWSATRRCMEAQGEQFFWDAYEHVASLWGDTSTKRIVRMELFILAGRNEK